MGWTPFTTGVVWDESVFTAAVELSALSAPRRSAGVRLPALTNVPADDRNHRSAPDGASTYFDELATNAADATDTPSLAEDMPAPAELAGMLDVDLLFDDANERILLVSKLPLEEVVPEYLLSGGDVIDDAPKFRDGLAVEAAEYTDVVLHAAVEYRGADVVAAVVDVAIPNKVDLFEDSTTGGWYFEAVVVNGVETDVTDLTVVAGLCSLPPNNERPTTPPGANVVDGFNHPVLVAGVELPAYLGVLMIEEMVFDGDKVEETVVDGAEAEVVTLLISAGEVNLFPVLQGDPKLEEMAE